MHIMYNVHVSCITRTSMRFMTTGMIYLHTLYMQCTLCTNSLLYLLKSWSSFFLSTAALGGSTKYRTGSVKKLSVAASILQSLRERQLMAVCSSVPVMVTNCRTLERWDCFNLCCRGGGEEKSKNSESLYCIAGNMAVGPKLLLRKYWRI